jgi:hypothetical protein
LQWCTLTTAASGISPLQRHCTPRTVAAARRHPSTWPPTCRRCSHRVRW